MVVNVYSSCVRPATATASGMSRISDLEVTSTMFCFICCVLSPVALFGQVDFQALKIITKHFQTQEMIRRTRTWDLSTSLQVRRQLPPPSVESGATSATAGAPAVLLSDKRAVCNITSPVATSSKLGLIFANVLQDALGVVMHGSVPRETVGELTVK